MEKDSDSKGQDRDTDGGAKPSRRRERREDSAEDKIQSENVNESMQNAPNDGAKPRRRRPAGEPSDGGWMSMSDPKHKNSASGDGAVAQTDESEITLQVANNKNKYFEENNDDIMVIPDLEEDGNETDQRIAHAPRVVRKIPTLTELENEVKATTPTMESGYDLGVLLTTLVPASLVAEEDVPWTFETLLRDVTDEFLAPNKTVAPGAPKTTDYTTKSQKGGKEKDKSKDNDKSIEKTRDTDSRK